MVDRINLILKAKNITARQFAESIGIQPSGMSHILSGRNNPSLDFVMKVMRRWPEININWLMFGKGEMYVPQEQQVHYSSPIEPDLFSQPEDTLEQPVRELPEFTQPSTPLIPNPVAPASNTVETPTTKNHQVSVYSTNPDDSPVAAEPQPNENRVNNPNPEPEPVQPNLDNRRLVKIIFVYDNLTFQEVTPA